MSKAHLSLYAIIAAVVALLGGWQGGNALAGRHHRQRMDNPVELAKLLVEASIKKQGQMVDSITRIDRLEANGAELTYHLTLLNRSGESPPKLTARERQYFVRRMCTTSETAYLLSKNVKVRLVYKDSNGAPMVTLPIAAADCAGVR